MRKHQLAAMAVGGLVAVGCTAGSDDAATTDTGGPPPTDVTAPSATFPADDRATGVTDDTIRLGVTYVDLASLGDVVDIDHGDYEAAYQAIADDINAAGGINGRQLELSFAPVLPIGTDDADAECVRLTEDLGVFAVVGSMIDDAPLCFVGLHDTPVVGGFITQERLDQAQAPWFTNVPAVENVTTRLIDAVAAEGVFDDATVGVIALPEDEGLMREVAEPALAAQGVEAAELATIDAPPDDLTAGLQQVGVIAERFQAAGVDTVVAIGNAALPTGQGLAQTDFRPRLVASSYEGLATYVNAAEGFDETVVEGAISGGYAQLAPDVQWADPAMQDCVALVEEATGESVADPATLDPGDPEHHVSVFTACQQLSIFRQIAEAAGDELDNGSFGEAGYTLGEIEVPGAGGPATYGPDSLDGSMPLFLLRYDSEAGELDADDEPVG